MLTRFVWGQKEEKRIMYHTRQSYTNDQMEVRANEQIEDLT